MLFFIAENKQEQVYCIYSILFMSGEERILGQESGRESGRESGQESALISAQISAQESGEESGPESGRESGQESGQESRQESKEQILKYIVVHNNSGVHNGVYDHNDEIDEQNQQMYDSASDKSDCSSTMSCYSGVHLQFILSADEMCFTEFVRLCVIVTTILTISASVSFFSSLYPVLLTDEQKTHTRNSTVDAFVLTSSVMAIDISSVHTL